MSCSHWRPSEYDPAVCGDCAADVRDREEFAERIKELEDQVADLEKLNESLESEAANIAARQLEAEALRDQYRTERDEFAARVADWIGIAESERKSGVEFCRQIQSLTALIDQLSGVLRTGQMNFSRDHIASLLARVDGLK